MVSINYLAILIAAVVAFVLGFLFHGPLFGKLWMKLANVKMTGKEKMSDMYGKMFWNFVVQLLTATALSVIYLYASSSPLLAGSSNAAKGLICAFWAWLGFIVASSSIEVIWMGKSFKLWLFECGSSFIVMMAMGLIISSW